MTGELQDGLSITVSADNGVGSRMTWVRMADDAVDGMNLQFADYDQSQSTWVYHQLATNLDRTVWHRIDMRVYFQDGPSNDAVQIFLDGEYLLTGTTWEDFMRFPHSGGGGGGITPVNSILFRAGGTAAPATLGQGFYIDNVSLESDTPEPGTVVMLLAGIAAMIVISRQQR